MDTATTTMNVSSKRTPPKALATTYIKKHTSLLQSNIPQALDSYCSKHLELFQKAYTKEKQIQHLKRDLTLIPKSARIKFTVHVPKGAEETEEFKGLQEGIEEILDRTRRDLKAKIIAAMKLELTLLQKEIKTSLVKALRPIAEIFIISSNISVDKDTVVASLIESYHNTILKHSKMNYTEFNILYRATHMLSVYPRLLETLSDKPGKQPEKDSTTLMLLDNDNKQQHLPEHSKTMMP
eukprot:1204889-Ditylum_brightwellii.AAC.1